MAYRCPYCRTVFDALPPDSRCPACERVMRGPLATTPQERAARRRRLERMAFDADRRIAEIRHGPSARALYSPKVMFAVLIIFTIVGGLLVQRANPKKRLQRELPHQVALRQLDTLATALGRYRFHVGAYPADEPGLRALLDNPGADGWNGPYVNQLIADPWRSHYRYARSTNNWPRLFSCGPDGLPGTADDLRPDPAAFDPGTDWTNGWVRAALRHPILIIRQKDAAATGGH